MDYKKIYDTLIQKRKVEKPSGYIERHHIIPRSLGGTDDKDNIVCLTAKEHYLCHYLLTKIYKPYTNEWYRMIMAFNMMLCKSDNNKRIVNGRNYKWFREAFSITMSESQSNEKNSQYGSIWIYNPELKLNKKMNKECPLPDGWVYGRILNQDKESKRIEERKYKELEKEKKLKNNIDKYTNWYKIYNEFGFEEFCNITGYDKSKPNLVRLLSKYAIGFKPQNGKPRGK